MERKIIGATKLQWQQLFEQIDKGYVYPNSQYTLKSGKKIYIHYRDTSTSKEERGVIIASFIDGESREQTHEVVEELRKEFSKMMVLDKERIIKFMNSLQPKLKQVLIKIRKVRSGQTARDLATYIISQREDILTYLRGYENDAQAQAYMPRMLGKYQKSLWSLRRMMNYRT